MGGSKEPLYTPIFPLVPAEIAAADSKQICKTTGSRDLKERAVRNRNGKVATKLKTFFGMIKLY
ncbi:MAG: hypothetical protein A2X34_06280 [Elusimicrobia bacterium GWC2_51_8]|nr:MAG: hypothetical protein A2X33_05770 [Elusimicrobia bacterium GWA2_51_34]OGR59147.1 MAG: hypothetical protein A2X34_06280 [Elusimicrobia bacterium GWC2_51_8]OGR85470.1 MAG: hypothetical protein A2021_08040 [Elusimicrobia bacterium GWF2_52_66]